MLHLWGEISASKVETVSGLSEVLTWCQKDQAVLAVHREAPSAGEANGAVRARHTFALLPGIGEPGGPNSTGWCRLGLLCSSVHRAWARPPLPGLLPRVWNGRASRCFHPESPPTRRGWRGRYEKPSSQSRIWRTWSSSSTGWRRSHSSVAVGRHRHFRGSPTFC
jgi:hypothetical protein